MFQLIQNQFFKNGIFGLGGCGKCMARVPYGTLIATVMCCAGALAFLICLYRAVRLTLSMFESVFTYNLEW